MRRPSLLAALLAGAVLVAGCGDDDTSGPAPAQSTGPAAPGTTATAPPAPAPSVSTTSTSAPLAGAGLDPQRTRGTATEVALLRGVRVGRHGTYERVVFEFEGDDVPAASVAYADGEISQDGSGEPVPVAGGAALEVRMEPALDADLSKPDAPRTYDGPGRIEVGGAALTEVVRVGGFEGVLAFAVGTRERLPFVARTLRDPPRIVVDVATG